MAEPDHVLGNMPAPHEIAGWQMNVARTNQTTAIIACEYYAATRSASDKDKRSAEFLGDVARFATLGAAQAATPRASAEPTLGTRLPGWRRHGRSHLLANQRNRDDRRQ